MDTKELIHKCKAITLKEEETNKISFIGNMRRKWEKLSAHCLIRKIFAVKRSEYRSVENGNAANVEVSARNQSGEPGRQYICVQIPP